LKAREKVTAGWNSITGKDTEAGKELREGGSLAKRQRELKKAKKAEEKIKKGKRTGSNDIVDAEKRTKEAEKSLKSYKE
jgi:hypothetical protein